LKPLRAAFLALILLVGSVSLADARSWSIDDFDSRITVHPDSSIAVDETITLRFEGQYNGIYRTIPYRYTSNYGSRYTLRMAVGGVTDGNNAPLNYEIENKSGSKDIKIWVPGAADTVKTVRISYTVLGAILFFNDHDELYWNVTGTEWPVPIRHAQATVTLPAEVKGAGINFTAFTGISGSTGRNFTASIQDGNTVVYETTAPLNYKEGLTIVCGWPKGFVQPIPASTKFFWFVADNWYVLIPLVVFAAMFLLWRARGRDPALGRSLMPRYDPPDRLTPGEVGTLADEKANMRDISATLVDLAVNGYIRIREEEEKGFIFSKKDYTFTLLKTDFARNPKLKKHETELLQGIFGSGTEKKLSNLTNTFYTHMPAIINGLYNLMVSDGYFNTRPDGTRTGYYVIAGILAGCSVASIPLGEGPNAVLIVSLLLSAVIVALFAPHMPKKTKKGAEALWHIRGFEEYLSRAEKDRLKLDTPETFERFLPYAIALGVAEQWAKAFKDICKEPPGWYEGQYGVPFNTMIFLNNLNVMNRAAAGTFTSAPRSSSSGASGGHSGFGGGGFSGGGFGGGGGRAW